MKLRRLFRPLRRRLGAEDGIALIVALAATVVLGIMGTSVFVYTSSNGSATRLTATETSAHAVAEAGLQAAFSVLYNPDNNALDPTLLPPATVTLNEGYANWSGALTVPANGTPYWLVTSTGFVRNPDAGSPAVQTIKAQVSIVPSLTHPLNNPAWNYIYTTHPVTPGVCDETIQQSVNIVSPLYVNGNLCLQNTATIGAGPLDVQGSLTMFQKANGVGTPSSPINDAHIGNGCKWWNRSYDKPCLGSPDNVYAKVLDNSFVPIPVPTVYWDEWYMNASPGPYYPCTTSNGPVPMFDNDQFAPPGPGVVHRNDSVAVPFNLTPSVSYTCKTAGGELSWDASKNQLTVSGTFFIDGSAYIENGNVNTYGGMGTLYLSGVFLEKNSKLCAALNASKTDCNFSGWNPNKNIVGIVANGSGGIVNVGDSEQFVSSTFEGAVYATNNIDTDTTSLVLGPMFGNAINLGQSVNTNFPKINLIPVGFPGSPAVFAQPQPAIYLTG